jgi:hypothetical protein
MLDRRLVPAGPAGDRQTIHLDGLGATFAGTIYNIEGHLLHHSTPKKICGKYYCDISQVSSVSKKFRMKRPAGSLAVRPIPRPPGVCALPAGRMSTLHCVF